MVVDLTMKHTSLMSRLFDGHYKVETGGPALSKIQTLPAELKLQILKDAANISVVKNLVIACPAFYPVYCENKYKVLLNAHRTSQDKHTDVLAEVLLKIHQLDGSESSRRAHAWHLWERRSDEYDRRDRVSFVDSEPPLSDLIEVSRVHCWVVEKSEEFLQTAVCPKLLWPDIYKWLYYIEILAAIIGDKERGWLAAGLPECQWEKDVQYWSLRYDFERMSDIVKVIWPNGLWKTPACRRRTRALILHSVRRRGTVYSSECLEY